MGITTILSIAGLAASAGSTAIGIANANSARSEAEDLALQQKRQQDKLLQEARDRAKKQESDAYMNARAEEARSVAKTDAAGGYRSTILTGPMGTGSEPLAPRHTLLGE